MRQPPDPPTAGAVPANEQEFDHWLVRAAADGDERAFEQLVRRHTPALYAGALRVTGSAALAEDVVQDAWLSAWLHLGQFRGHSAVRTWLVRIVTTKALNALRRPHRTLPLETVPPTTSTSTEQEAERRDLQRAVRQAVADLPVRQREVVVLRDLEALAYEEIAVVLSCSVSSVKSSLYRGRQALARSLAAHQPALGRSAEPGRPGALWRK